MTQTIADLHHVGVPVRTGCALVGRSRATHYRHQDPVRFGPTRPRVPASNGQALSAVERADVLRVINTDANADLAICQIWARELNEGCRCCVKTDPLVPIEF